MQDQAKSDIIMASILPKLATILGTAGLQFDDVFRPVTSTRAPQKFKICTDCNGCVKFTSYELKDIVTTVTRTAIEAEFGPPPYHAEEFFASGPFDPQIAALAGNVELFKNLASPQTTPGLIFHSTANVDCLEYMLEGLNAEKISYNTAFKLANHASHYGNLASLKLLHDRKIQFNYDMWYYTAIRADDAKVLGTLLDEKEFHQGSLKLPIFRYKSIACFRLYVERYIVAKNNTFDVGDIVYQVLYHDQPDMIAVLAEYKLITETDPTLTRVIRANAIACLAKLVELGWTFTHSDMEIAKRLTPTAAKKAAALFSANMHALRC